MNIENAEIYLIMIDLFGLYNEPDPVYRLSITCIHCSRFYRPHKT